MRTIDFLDKRVTGICNELKKLSVKQKFETSDWLIKPGNFLRPEDADADPAPFEPFDSRTMHWYGPDKHYWFRADVAVPQEMDGKPLWMHVCTQIDEWDDAKNPQFLLFVDDVITQGVDASRIRTQGLGPANPIASNSTAEGKAQNRRVDITLSPL